ncbi:hypothetical protein [Nocardioides bigeumensis]|jgi:hypothetical protein|uniref:Uncharacterized protein n=1 Tax=Nocardioides bigeumensis TaxID=433657 RepID=A0ABP5KRQ9_9ACTN
MNIFDPTAAMVLLVVVSVVTCLGVALTAVTVGRDFIARRPARTATQRPATSYPAGVAAAH